MKILVAGVVVLMASLVGGGTAAAASPACFGAADRDPRHPCTNPTLSITPAPHNNHEPETACTALKRHNGAPVCAFGAPASKARRKFALVGDSHSRHWRATLDVVGKVKRWRGFSMSAGGCHYTQAVKHFVMALREPCKSFNIGVLNWIRAHPEISTVFVTQNSAAVPLVGAPPDERDQLRVTGFARAWRALPKHVKHVIVIRDNPVSTPQTIACVSRVFSAGMEPAQTACRLARSAALRRDMAVVAAQRLRSQRYQYIDMTPYFCSRRYCYPVIGGALVNTDSFGHISLTFARTLAPYLLRRLRTMTSSW